MYNVICSTTPTIHYLCFLLHHPNHCESTSKLLVWYKFFLLFYWSLSGPNSKGRRTIAITIFLHIGMSKNKFTCNMDRSKIRSLWARFNVHSNYQVQGAFAHLGQETVWDLVDAISAATDSIEYINDPYRLQNLYKPIALRIKKSSDCVVENMLALFTIMCCLVILILQELSRLLCIVVRRSINLSLPDPQLKSRKQKCSPLSCLASNNRFQKQVLKKLTPLCLMPLLWPLLQLLILFLLTLTS